MELESTSPSWWKTDCSQVEMVTADSSLPCTLHWYLLSPQKEWETPQSQQWSVTSWLYPQVKCNQYIEIWAKSKYFFYSSLHYLNLIVSTVKYYEEYHRRIQSKNPHYEKLKFPHRWGNEYCLTYTVLLFLESIYSQFPRRERQLKACKIHSAEIKIGINFVSFVQKKGNSEGLKVARLRKQQISPAELVNNWFTFVT